MTAHKITSELVDKRQDGMKYKEKRRSKVKENKEEENGAGIKKKAKGRKGS